MSCTRARRNCSKRSRSAWRRAASKRGSRSSRPELLRRGSRSVRQGERRDGRVGRLRPLVRVRRRGAPDGAAGARRDVPRRLGPASRLVPQLAADERSALRARAVQGRSHPRIHRGREGPQDVEVARQRGRAPEGDEHARRRHPAPVGRGHGLRERDQRLRHDPQAHGGFVPPRCGTRSAICWAR